MANLYDNINESNVEVQNRFGMSLPPCYMLIPTSSMELWNEHIREGYDYVIRCMAKDGFFENHVYTITCVSPNEPKLILCINKQLEESLLSNLGNPIKISDEFYNDRSQYIYLPWFTEDKEWAKHIYRLITINVMKRGMLMLGNY